MILSPCKGTQENVTMGKEDIFLSQKESRRVYVMEQVIQGKITVRQAARVLGLSERQIKRLKAGIKERGIAALAHGNRGRKPKHAVPDDVKTCIVELALEEYRDASYQHMSELLAEHKAISLSAKTIGRILKEAGIPHRHTHKAARRRRSRDRMPQAGMLVQMDASPFAWLEDRGPSMSLHGAIDDATGMVLGLYFRPEEDTLGYMHVLKQIVDKHGVPRSLYSDGHTIFFSPKHGKLSIEEELAGKKVNLTQFGRAIEQLDIGHIRALSPQAKGRVERLWGTLQHRLMVELRLANATTLEEANEFLLGFIDRFNRRFAVEAADPEAAFRSAPDKDTLKSIICFREVRKASKGSSISFKGTTYQLVDSSSSVVLLRPRSTVYVLRYLDGSLGAMYDGNCYALKALPVSEKAMSKQSSAEESRTVKPSPKVHKPAAEHPWRRPMVKRRRDPVEEYFVENEWRHLYAQY